MASVSTDKNGNRRIVFSLAPRQRKAIYLGDIPMRDAKEICTKVSALVAEQLSKAERDPIVARWVGEIPDVLATKLAKAGLIAPRQKRQQSATTLGGFIDDYLASRTDIKPRTRINLLQVRKNLVNYFGKDKPLADITPGETDEWRVWMRTREEPLGDNTIRRHCGRAKQLFRAALRKRIITENPFADMQDCTVRANRSREFFITLEMADKVLAACPDTEWKLIFALARFGGLRTPSETLVLRWQDVDWKRNRLLIRSPKTEHHEGKDSRLVPIFPELRPHLEAAWDQAAEGAEYVINRYRDCNANLRTQLLRIIARAGLTPWPKLFQNLRSTRETELAETNPLHLVTAWLGNSQLVATKHYLQVTDEHFAKAASIPTRITTRTEAEMRDETGNGVIRPLRDNEKAPVFPGLSEAGISFRNLHNQSVPRRGLEPP